MLPLEGLRPNIEHEADSEFPLFDFHHLGKDRDGEPIDFPDLEYFKHGHGKWVAHHAVVILGHEYPHLNNRENNRALWTAGLFHDIGRTEPWTKSDPTAAKRSADLLDIIIRTTSATAGEEKLRETACKLVYARDFRNRPSAFPDDPLLRCLCDADAYDASRFAPGTSEGLAVLKAATATAVLNTQWAKNKAHLRRYMAARGW
jgi:hypothetical protein